ncbi:MAG: D-3-phosphoglycerate dehydrogenase [Cyclobacteriaceae bacterium]|jgi:D-3-phosphoglycerate dehydrogenase
MSKKVLIIDDMHESISDMLVLAGFEPYYRPDIARVEILEIVHDYEVMIVRSKTIVDQELINLATKLKVIARAGAGMDKLDVNYLEKKSVKIINAPEGNRDAVAEHALGMLLALNHSLLKADSQVKSFNWDREGNRGFEVKDKTVGIFGYGFVGQAFAKRLSGFECKIIAYDKYKTQFGEENIQEVSLIELQENAQILSIHVPLTKETKSIFNAEFLSKFKKLEVLINTARGEVVVLEDLIEILDKRKLRGACLDVLEFEKFKELSETQKRTIEKLSTLGNVILSPHVAGWTFESYERINRVIVEKLRKLDF